MTLENLYNEDIQSVASENLPWGRLKDNVLLITGATGLLGHFLVDVIMFFNRTKALNCFVIAVGRSEKRARRKFNKYWDSRNFMFVSHDINEPLILNDIKKVNFVIHMASNTHPKMYATDPIGTITANIIGTKNMLDFSVTHNVNRFVFASSNEIYGENRGDVDLFRENYCGYINSNTLRAGYPESKRCGEALCQAYLSQRGIDIVIPRFTRSYGPTMLMNDTKAISQFILNGINHQNIVLKSKGLQNYSYTYISDAILGLLYIMLLGKSGEAYNVADVKSNITLKRLAQIIAENSGTRISFEKPDTVEQKGYSKATRALIDGSKLQKIGWQAKYDIKSGINRTMEILEQENGKKYN